jgi:hypothetical protein
LAQFIASENNWKLPCPGRDNSEISPAQRAGNVVPTESVLKGRRELKCVNTKMNCYNFPLGDLGPLAVNFCFTIVLGIHFSSLVTRHLSWRPWRLGG